MGVFELRRLIDRGRPRLACSATAAGAPPFSLRGSSVPRSGLAGGLTRGDGSYVRISGLDL